MHLVLTGATGLIGAGVLQHMLATEAVTRISIISRRPVPMANGHDKARVLLRTDFMNYDAELLEELSDAQGVVWALGTSQASVDKEEYRKITYHYPIRAARAFATIHPESPFNFVFISGAGATQTPNMLTSLYGRVKGLAEQALLDLHGKSLNFSVYNLRPGAVDWRSQPAIHSTMPTQPLYKRAVMPVLDSIYSSLLIKTQALGKVSTELALSNGAPLEGEDIEMEGRLVLNAAIKRMAGS
ncbi:hypothetical protein K491DRAFT_695507 [Lophiostoma macrostomum CBS 122681]|uniref:NAD-dependent epimerase/dehydratase domain-containing protein n=1 Tax=Lophiostoma macrostomum CBS 122681 TaxID=1314788 RepID=A0A6A6SXT0_9PLEO|nr:hypothetical protein K491DRAFT_695507 [Lophiostoma macrostomum CBS 122681]